MENLKFVKIFPDSRAPMKAHPTDVGFDVCMHNIKGIWRNSGGNGEVLVEKDEALKKLLLEKALVLPFGWRALVGTGIKATVGPGYEIQIRPRSGLAWKNGLTVLNTPGTIDEAYRDEVSVILINLSRADQVVNFGDRIAQLVVAPVVPCTPLEVKTLGGNARRGGFGSKGLKTHG